MRLGPSNAATAKGNKMTRTHILEPASFALLMIPLCLALAGCQGCSATPAPQSQAGATESAPAVAGNEALVNLGPVAPGSNHVVIFTVANPSDQPLVFKTVRGDCECISAIDPPDRIAPNGTARITVSYTAPKMAIEYMSCLLIATDNPSRRLISLRVKSSPLKR